jgi:hypothetical protein
MLRALPREPCVSGGMSLYWVMAFAAPAAAFVSAEAPEEEAASRPAGRLWRYVPAWKRQASRTELSDGVVVTADEWIELPRIELPRRPVRGVGGSSRPMSSTEEDLRDACCAFGDGN